MAFRARSALRPLVGFFAAGLGLSALYATTGVGVGCPFRIVTGWDCPLCGGTRMGSALLHGDVAAAAQHHLLFVFALPFLLYNYVTWASVAFFNKRLPRLRLGYKAVGIVLAVIGAPFFIALVRRRKTMAL